MRCHGHQWTDTVDQRFQSRHGREIQCSAARPAGVVKRHPGTICRADDTHGKTCMYVCTNVWSSEEDVHPISTVQVTTRPPDSWCGIGVPWHQTPPALDQGRLSHSLATREPTRRSSKPDTLPVKIGTSEPRLVSTIPPRGRRTTPFRFAVRRRKCLGQPHLEARLVDGTKTPKSRGLCGFSPRGRHESSAKVMLAVRGQG